MNFRVVCKFYDLFYRVEIEFCKWLLGNDMVDEYNVNCYVNKFSGRDKGNYILLC